MLRPCIVKVSVLGYVPLYTMLTLHIVTIRNLKTAYI